MSFAARDFFEARIEPPTIDAPPAPELPLFNYFVDRLIDSLDLPYGPMRYFQWMGLPDEDSWLGRGVRSLSLLEEWPRIKQDIEKGHPVPLGLIRAHSHDLGELGKNHQVLCFGYEATATGAFERILLYDPNHPGAEVVLSADDGTFVYSTGEPTRGFFRTPYRRSDPRFLIDPRGALPLFTLTALTARLRRLLPR
jgi:hypothetical protein